MADRRGFNDLRGAGGADPADDRENYKLNELAEMLDAPVEKVRQWLRDEDIHPVHPDRPEDYGMDAYEFVRMRRHTV